MKLSRRILYHLLLSSQLLVLPAAMAADTHGPATKVVPGTTTTAVDGQCSPGQCNGRGAYHKRGGFAKELGLTDDQLEKFAEKKTELKTAIGPIKAQQQALKAQLKLALLQANPDKDQIMSLQSKINATRDDIANKVLSSRLDMMDILTPDQRAKIRHRMLISSSFGGRGHHQFRGRGFRGQRAQG